MKLRASAEAGLSNRYHVAVAPSAGHDLKCIAAVIMIAALAPLASVMVEGWSQRDIELRARLVFRSIRDQVAAGIAVKPEFDLIPFFKRLAEDERILALGFCTDDGQLRYPTLLMPKPVTSEG